MCALAVGADTGNEAPIEAFCEATGFMWELAPKLGALVVFAEQRYYGPRFPDFAPLFENRLVDCWTTGDSIPQNASFQFLTSSQVLLDYVAIIQNLRQYEDGVAKAAIIAVGGSYGGMLAAWLRLKVSSSDIVRL